MPWKFSWFFISLSLCVGSLRAEAESMTVECYARGHDLRQTATDPGYTYTDSRLVIELDSTDTRAVMTKYFGHIMVKYVGSGRAAEFSADEYYGHFLGADKVSSLSPTATVYLDTNYFRFREFDASATSRTDGGGMWGYLVIGKAIRSQRTVDAHYVFQAGDHMGGTIDLTCSR